MTSRETNAEPVASTATLGEDGTVRADSRRRLLRRRLSRIRVGIGFLLLSAALLLAGIRLSLPAVENYRSEVQQWVSQILGRALTIDALSAYWRGWTPVLDMQGVRLLRADSIGARGESALTFERVRISIDPVASFASRAIVPNSIVLGGASFAIKYAADGSLRIAGMRTAGPGGDAGVTEDVARWLLRDGRLIFDSATVSWTDEEGRGTPLLLTNVRVQLLNRGEDHQLTGSFRLPGVSQDRIELALAARGDLLTSGWDGELLLSGNGVDVFPLVQIYRPIENWVTSGRADISFRGHWNNGALDRSETRIRADGLILAPGLGRLRIHEGNAEIRTGTMPTGLSADVVLTDVYTSEGRWRDTRGSINYLEGSDGVPDRLVGRFDHARLADILGLFGGETGTAAGDANPFAGYRANADLSALHFTLVPGPRMADSVSLTATFDNFSVFRSADLPSLSGFRGRVEMDGQHGVAILENGTVDVAGPDMFSGRFLVNTRGGRVAWNQDPVGPRLDVYNVEFRADGVQGQFTGSAQWDRGHDAPVVSILADVTSGDVAKLRRYIPAGVLPDGLVTWLRRSIVGGRVEQGNILVHGRMSDFPFDNATGMLEARVEIADGRLDYGDGWPALSELT
ncbi:MAG: DUF3971 domain-containing protein, partial [Gammaproteobacteria bacterium]|nr:DUF3971 domain-containing protein [Gammaproteobacteria bacterium]